MDMLTIILVLNNIKKILKNPIAPYIQDTAFQIDDNGVLKYSLELDESVIEELEFEIESSGALRYLIASNN